MSLIRDRKDNRAAMSGGEARVKCAIRNPVREAKLEFDDAMEADQP